MLWQVLTAVYDRLGFDVLADEAFQQLVLARVVEPTSKADSLRVLDELGVAHASLRSLQRTAAQGYRARLATACFAHASTAGGVSLCLYDVTTLYFRAEHEDELRKVGYSRNGGSTRRSWSGCWWTGPGSRWRSAASRATRPRPPRCC